MAAKNIELTRKLATVEAASSMTATPQQVLLPSVINTRLLKQPAASEGDRMTRADRACKFRAYANAVRHGRLDRTRAGCDRPVGLTRRASNDNQIHAQLYYVLDMLVKHEAIKKVLNAPVGHGGEIWRLVCEENEARQ